MSIKTISNRAVVTIHRQATVEDAARLMRSHHIGDVVVVEVPNAQVPVGMVTDRDIVVAVVAQGLMPAQTTVGSIMSSPVLTLRENDGFITALDRMAQRGVRRAPVVDEAGLLRGVVSVDDLVRLLARELAKVGALIMHEQTAEKRKTDGAFADEYAA